MDHLHYNWHVGKLLFTCTYTIATMYISVLILDESGIDLSQLTDHYNVHVWDTALDIPLKSIYRNETIWLNVLVVIQCAFVSGFNSRVKISVVKLVKSMYVYNGKVVHLSLPTPHEHVSVVKLVVVVNTDNAIIGNCLSTSTWLSLHKEDQIQFTVTSQLKLRSYCKS